MRKYLICLGLLVVSVLGIAKSEVAFAMGEMVDATDQAMFGENALVPNAEESQSQRLQVIVNLTSKENNTVYIPKGQYVINESIKLSNHAQITGDLTGATVLMNRTAKEVVLTDANYSTTKDVGIQHLFLDGVSVFARFSDNISVENNVFFNLSSKFPIDINASNYATINTNIFMRDYTHSQPNDTYNRTIFIGGYATQNRYEYMEHTQVNGNLFGLKINELDAIKSFSPTKTSALVNKLQNAIEADRISIAGGNEQNYFSTGINSYSMLKHAEIKENLFYQNYDNEDMHGVSGDHAIYLRGSQDVQVVGNHLRGLHNGPAGGFKFKSGRNVTIMNNYFRNTGIIMYGTPEYGYGNSYADGASSELTNWLVANNTFDWKYWQERYAIGIEYNKHTGTDNVKNGVFINNHYVNFHNIPANRRRALLTVDSRGDGFKSDSTFVGNNTRDDTVDQQLLVHYWEQEDYLAMPKDWTELIDPSLYNYYQDISVPIRNTLPIAVEDKVVVVGDAINPLDLVEHTNDADETSPTAKILNPEVLNEVGQQTVDVQLIYADDSIVELQVIVQVNPA